MNKVKHPRRSGGSGKSVSDPNLSSFDTGTKDEAFLL